MKKNIFLRVGAVALIAVLFLRVGGGYAVQVAAQRPYYNETVVVLDAGHGDFDPGAVARDGSEEKDVNLAITLKLRDIFEANGFAVAMTRTDDITMADEDASSVSARKKTDTRNRVALAESFSDAVLISIHQNAFADASQHGTQMFYGTCSEDSKRLAQSLMDSVVTHVQPDNTRPLKKGTDSIYILVHTHTPTVLVECGFITNDGERARLRDETYQRQLAYAIFLGYLDYLNAPEGEVNGG